MISGVHFASMIGSTRIQSIRLSCQLIWLVDALGNLQSFLICCTVSCRFCAARRRPWKQREALSVACAGQDGTEVAMLYIGGEVGLALGRPLRPWEGRVPRDHSRSQAADVGSQDAASDAEICRYRSYPSPCCVITQVSP